MENGTGQLGDYPSDFPASYPDDYPGIQQKPAGARPAPRVEEMAAMNLPFVPVWSGIAVEADVDTDFRQANKQRATFVATLRRQLLEQFGIKVHVAKLKDQFVLTGTTHSKHTDHLRRWMEARVSAGKERAVGADIGEWERARAAFLRVLERRPKTPPLLIRRMTASEYQKLGPSPIGFDPGNLDIPVHQTLGGFTIVSMGQALPTMPRAQYTKAMSLALLVLHECMHTNNWFETEIIGWVNRVRRALHLPLRGGHGSDLRYPDLKEGPGIYMWRPS